MFFCLQNDIFCSINTTRQYLDTDRRYEYSSTSDFPGIEGGCLTTTFIGKSEFLLLNDKQI